MYSLVLIVFLAASTTAVPPFFRSSRLLPDGRIIGGSSIPISQVPYQISLEKHGLHDCGGSIVSPNYVITAAHCTNGLPAAIFRVRAGTAIRESGGQVVSVEVIHQHPSYDWKTKDYDISVLKVSTLVYGENVQPISLPALSTTWPVGTSVLVTGWGTLAENQNLHPTDLQGVTVQLISHSSCSTAYKDGITNRMLCAGVTGGGKDACQGDSGGPLAINGTLGGIVSWGYGCARSGYPGVYSSVPALRTFIAQTAGI